MNIQAMMQQAEKIKKEIMLAKKAVEEKEFNLKKEMFDLKTNGKKEILEIKFNFEKLEKEDLEILEDMLMIGLNEAFKIVDDEMEQTMKKYDPGLTGLF